MTDAERLREFVRLRRQFATDPVFADYVDVTDACEAGADALDRLAQTCGNCQHAYVDPDLVREIGPLPWGWCKAPEKDSPRATQILTRYPFSGNPVPLDERCKGWTKREDA